MGTSYESTGSFRGLLGLTLFIAACGEPTAVQPALSATYALETSNAQRLPQVMQQGADHQYTLLGDTLRFSPDGRVRRATVVRSFTSKPTRVDTIYTHINTFPYEIDGRRLLMGYFRTPCPPNANCIGFDEGVIDEARITMNARLFWPGEPAFVFRRL